MSGNYALLSNSSHHSEDSINLTVLKGERKLPCKANKTCKISELKIIIESISEVPPSQQRLIFKGRLVQPDDKTIDSFSIVDNSVIHLFPIPIAHASAVSNSTENATTAGSNTAAAVASPMHVSIDVGNSSSGNNTGEEEEYSMPQDDAYYQRTPIEMNPFVNHTCREVRLWSIILIMLSVLTIANNLSAFLTTGDFGNTALDSIVFILDTGVSVAGVYVGKQGLICARTLDLTEVKKYLLWLGIVTGFAVTLRILWVFDIIDEVKKAVTKSQQDAAGRDPDAVDPATGEPYPPPLDDGVVDTVSVQANIICMICICCWLSCVVRAIRLRNVIQRYERLSSQAPANADAVTTVSSTDEEVGTAIVVGVDGGTTTAQENGSMAPVAATATISSTLAPAATAA